MLDNQYSLLNFGKFWQLIEFETLGLRMQDFCDCRCWRCRNKNCSDRINRYKLTSRGYKEPIALSSNGSRAI